MKNILVFPCGSEIGLEIYRALNGSTHFSLIGASSVEDHGKFVYDNYIGNLPYITDESFDNKIIEILISYKIDIIYPTMDYVIYHFKKNEKKFGCKIVSSDFKTVEICLSKSKTYSFLKESVRTPEIFDKDEIKNYPVFIKPDVGYGSRGTRKVNHKNELGLVSEDYIICEYLPGNEYTIDCFTNFQGNLTFVGVRERIRISNGISVNTVTWDDAPIEFFDFAKKINEKLKFNGAWFFQVKRDNINNLTLLEIASRFAGSSTVYRARGINFALLSLFNLQNIDLTIIQNDYKVELDRALENRFKLDINFKNIYVDYDDTILINGFINFQLIGLLYKFLNESLNIYLITKHKGDIYKSLNEYKISSDIFKSIYHLKEHENKSDYINGKDSIFIDDSFAERKKIKEILNIPVFSVDMIETLLK